MTDPLPSAAPAPTPVPQDKHAPSIDDVAALMSDPKAAPPGSIPKAPARPQAGDNPADTLGDEDSVTGDDGTSSDAETIGEPEPQDETEGDTADDETTAEEAADADDAEHVYLVKINGEEREVTASELIKGYQLESVARQKMDKAAAVQRQAEEQQRRFEAEAQRVSAVENDYRERIQRYDELLPRLQRFVEDAERSNPWAHVDWDKLEAEDPIEAGRQYRAFQRWQTDHEQKKRAVQAENQRREREQLEERQRTEGQAQVHLRTKLAEMFPEWADPAVRNKDIAEMSAYARELGYGEDELSRWYRPQDWKVLRDATLHRRSQQAARQVTNPPPTKPNGAAKAGGTTGAAPKPIRIVRPDAPRPNPMRTARATEVKALFDRARRTGSADDVAALMSAQDLNKPR